MIITMASYSKVTCIFETIKIQPVWLIFSCNTYLISITWVWALSYKARPVSRYWSNISADKTNDNL